MSGTSGRSGSSRKSDGSADLAADPVAARAELGAEETTALVTADSIDGEPAVGEMPPVPDHIREAARLAPDHWFGLIDPTWSGEGEPPQWAIAGQWRSDLEGEIAEWRDNEDYRPSPSAMGWPDPTDPVDSAVQLAATGYGSAEEVTRVLAEAEVAVFVAPGGGLVCAIAPDGETSVVPVFTSPEYLHAAGRFSFKAVMIRELLDQLPEGHLIYLNPSGPVSMAVESAALRESGGNESGGNEDEDGVGVEGWLGALDDVLSEPMSGSLREDDSAPLSSDAAAATPTWTGLKPGDML